MALGKGLGAFFPTSAAPVKEVTAEIEKEEISTHPVASSGEVTRNIPLTSIHANPNQPRKEFRIDELNDLVASIESHGILQPIVVSEDAEGGYEIIAGERRFRASQMIGLVTIPAIIRPADERSKLEMALIENIQREDLNPIEEAYAYKRLVDEFGVTQQDVATRVGKSRPHVANMIRLLDLPQDVQKGLIEGKIAHSKARTLLGLPTIRQQLKMYYDMIEDKSFTSREAEAVIREHRTTKGWRDPIVDEIESRLRARYGTKVYVINRKGKGSIKIEFYSDEEFRKILNALEGRILE